MSIIHLSENAIAVIQQDARSAYPDECCGFIYGSEAADGVRFALEAVPVQNSREGDRRRRFEIAPRDYLQAEAYALHKGLTLLGVYHSHPDHPAIASETDLAQALPWLSYVIIALDAVAFRDIRSWKLADDARVFEEEQLRQTAERDQHIIHT